MLRRKIKGVTGALPIIFFIFTVSKGRISSIMSESHNHLLRKYFGDVVERGQLNNLTEFFDEKAIFHFPNGDWNLEELKAFIIGIRNHLVNLNVEIEHEESTEDKISARVLFLANKKTNNSAIEWRTNTTWRFENNKCVETWPNFNVDFNKLEHQIGILPASSQYTSAH